MNDTAAFDLQPTLAGPTLRLAPLRPGGFEALYAVASDPLIWEQHPESKRYQRPVFERFFDGAIESGGALVATDARTGEVLGTSRFYHWRPDVREVAIGYTFLARRCWGGPANREMKALMLGHAFRWARRVWFHVGKDNWRSRTAMTRIGGVLTPDGPADLDAAAREHVFFRIDAPA